MKIWIERGCHIVNNTLGDDDD